MSNLQSQPVSRRAARAVCPQARAQRRNPLLGAIAKTSAGALLAAGLAVLPSCSGGGGGGTGGGGGGGGNTGNARLVSVSYGRLVDVYGLRTVDDVVEIALVERDVLIGPDIQDERPPSSNKRDEEILYDFLSANPDNLQPRVLITREIGSPEFDAGFVGLGARLKEVTAARFGDDVTQRPFSVVPRNVALQLNFSQSLGITDDFFYVVERGAAGDEQVVGVRNTEAIQLLEVVGDPNDADPRGDFRVIPTRFVVRGDKLIVDPVLLGSEGATLQVRNSASGMPASPDQVGANIRIAVALEGPLRINGVTGIGNEAYLGANNQAFESVIRDFRSGNSADSSADIASGFVRDAEPPRVIGQIPMLVASVEDVDSRTQVVRLYKNGRVHGLDRGDVVRFINPNPDPSLGEADVFPAEIVSDPVDDALDPSVQLVRAVVTRGPDWVRTKLNPTGRPGFPGFGAPAAQLDAWLRANANRAVVVAEYEFGDDDPVNFLSFSPSPLPLADGSPSPVNENVSPFAEAIIRFTKPVDIKTVGSFDTFFFATRNVVEDAAIADFVSGRQIDPDSFRFDKFVTPHLVTSRVIDEDGSQTAIRLQPIKGFYLDEEMRFNDVPAAQGGPTTPRDYRYWLHLLGGANGVRDLAGNPIDFQSTGDPVSSIAIPFSLDTRKDPAGRPLFADNLVVSVVRRFADTDEDEQPSYYLDDEINRLDPTTGSVVAPAEAFALQDLFGAVVYLAEGSLQARPTARVRKVVDDLNQQPPPAQGTLFQYCPDVLGGEGTVASASAGVRFGQPIQNPLNPFGARLQAVWRELDMSLSRIDPFDFNLDVEQMYWAPFTNGVITYDEFDRVSLFLGHSEFRPEPCVGAFSSLPELVDSGLRNNYADNYAHNKAIGTGAKTDSPAPHPAYVDQRLVIDAALAFTEPNGVNRFLPLPEFQRPYFVWRDETLNVQGGNSLRGSDAVNANRNMTPYIPSPWLGGAGRYVTPDGDDLRFNVGKHYNVQNYQFASPSSLDSYTGGLVPTIGLPLLADFWTYCDDPDLPVGNGFVATGFNGWQIALTVQSSAQPNFRAYSGGFAGTGTRSPVCVSPSDTAWVQASGGYTPTGGRTTALDNSMYWVMADFVKRQTVVTSGFVDALNPHRMPSRIPASPSNPDPANPLFSDPRLGPFFADQSGNSQLPTNLLPNFDWTAEPPLTELPGGTAIIPEFRAATELDPAPWPFATFSGQLRWPANGVPQPNAQNFPLDPLKAGDAHVRKYDNRTVNGQRREWWAHFYNRSVSEYTRNITDLATDSWTSQYSGPNENFNARDVRYFNWRFIMRNNVDASPPISPTLDSFAVTYRYERIR